MEKYRIVCILGFLSSMVVTASSDCPDGCSCNLATITCHNFPDLIPGDILEVQIQNIFVPASIPKLNYDNITTLVIENSQLPSVDDDAFSSLLNLTLLSLNGIQLQELKSDVFRGLAKLKDLKLNNNRLKSLPIGLFSHIPQLETLELNNNPGIMLNGSSFEGADHLTELSLRENELTEVPYKAFRNLPKLQKLSLNRNSFQNILGESFRALVDLRELELDSCAMEDFDELAFAGLKMLRKLYLGNNQLTEIDSIEFEDLTSLKVLDLSHNMLTSFSDDVLEKKKLTELYLGHNNWKCDCEIQWMKTLDLTRIDHENVTCSKPDNLAGHSLVNVTAEMLCGSTDGYSNSRTIALAVGIPIVIILVAVLCYYVYKYCMAKKANTQSGSHRYSAVYRDTTEAKNDPYRPSSEL